jgi:hypothetical protein
MPAGGGETTVAAPVTECPAYVPAGTVLVLLPEGADTAVEEGGVDSGVARVSSFGDDREIRVWGGGSSEFVEAGGTLRYVWSGEGAGATGGAVTWNGGAVPVSGREATVSGNGTLSFGGGGVLTVEGGAADREVVVRWNG